MAKRKAARRATAARTARKRATSSRRPLRKARKAKKATGRKAAKARKRAPVRNVRKAARPRTSAAKRKTAARKRPEAQVAAGKTPRLDRVRRTLDEGLPTPPSSLNMDRHGSAARTGRAELEQHRREHGKMVAVTSGDPDVNVDNAYFSGDEAPGGDNPTPDQDIVDDIGRALGVEYNDNEELRSGDKVTDRDKHRWELDPASSEDYKERD